MDDASSPRSPVDDAPLDLVFAALQRHLVAIAPRAEAQTSPVPQQSTTWDGVSNATMASAAVLQLAMPRIFYADPEVTEGWKARWHISQLAPVMTLVSIGALNEYAIKNALQDPRPGCDSTNIGGPGCTTYGGPSTQSFGAAAAFGNGLGVWLVDTVKWSGGKFNVGSFIGDVALPLVLGTITMVGRGAGNFESGLQIAEGGIGGVCLGGGRRRRLRADVPARVRIHGQSLLLVSPAREAPAPGPLGAAGR